MSLLSIDRKIPSARARRARLSVALCAGSACALLAPARVARADVSSWAFVGGGGARLQQTGLPATTVPAMRLELGLGTPPSNPIVFGGVLSLDPYFGHGSDLSLLFRTASRGYVGGDFGLALDVGPYERFWGQKSVGGEGTLWFGAPWGICLGVNAGIGSESAREFSGIIGLDFARLTVYRTSGTSWFINPFPADRPKD